MTIEMELELTLVKYEAEKKTSNKDLPKQTFRMLGEQKKIWALACAPFPCWLKRNTHQIL